MLPQLTELAANNKHLLQLFSDLSPVDQQHYTDKMQAVVSAPSRLLLSYRIQDIPATGIFAETCKQNCKDGHVNEVIDMIKEQYNQGEGTHAGLVAIFGKELLEKIVNF